MTDVRDIGVHADRSQYWPFLLASATPAANGLPLFDASGNLPEGIHADGSITTAKLAVPKLGVLTESFLKSAFTDGGAAVGTMTMAGTIPIGALILLTKVLVPAAWTGDTSAVLTIGDGSDVDRYNTGTPSLFTQATNGVEVGVPSGSKLQTSAVSPVLTVTSASDFTAVSGTARVTVSIYYIVTL